MVEWQSVVLANDGGRVQQSRDDPMGVVVRRLTMVAK